LIGLGDYQTAALGHKQSFVILTVQWLLTAISGHPSRSQVVCRKPAYDNGNEKNHFVNAIHMSVE
jgi:hypothetical protein